MVLFCFIEDFFWRKYNRKIYVNFVLLKNIDFNLKEFCLGIICGSLEYFWKYYDWVFWVFCEIVLVIVLLVVGKLCFLV